MSRDDDEDLTDLLGPDPTPPPAPEPKPLTPGRALQRRSRSYPVNRVGKLNSPERLKRLLKAISQMPVATDACKRSGISHSTLKLWLTRSSEGAAGDGFDINMGDEGKVRFHEAWDAAMLQGVEKVEVAMFNKAIGQQEPLTFQGRVIYKIDPDLVALGLEGPEAYLKDEFGAPVPESVTKQDPDLMQFILKARKSDTDGNKQQIDVNHRGGVLVVSAVAKSPEALTEEMKDFRQDAIDVEFEDVTGTEDNT
jgi:hypothetical protein